MIATVSGFLHSRDKTRAKAVTFHIHMNVEVTSYDDVNEVGEIVKKL